MALMHRDFSTKHLHDRDAKIRQFAQLIEDEVIKEHSANIGESFERVKDLAQYYQQFYHMSFDKLDRQSENNYKEDYVRKCYSDKSKDISIELEEDKEYHSYFDYIEKVEKIVKSKRLTRLALDFNERVIEEYCSQSHIDILEFKKIIWIYSKLKSKLLQYEDHTRIFIRHKLACIVVHKDQYNLVVYGYHKNGEVNWESIYGRITT